MNLMEVNSNGNSSGVEGGATVGNHIVNSYIITGLSEFGIPDGAVVHKVMSIPNAVARKRLGKDQHSHLRTLLLKGRGREEIGGFTTSIPGMKSCNLKGCDVNNWGRVTHNDKLFNAGGKEENLEYIRVAAYVCVEDVRNGVSFSWHYFMKTLQQLCVQTNVIAFLQDHGLGPKSVVAKSPSVLLKTLKGFLETKTVDVPKDETTKLVAAVDSDHRKYRHGLQRRMGNIEEQQKTTKTELSKMCESMNSFAADVHTFAIDSQQHREQLREILDNTVNTQSKQQDQISGLNRKTDVMQGQLDVHDAKIFFQGEKLDDLAAKVSALEVGSASAKKVAFAAIPPSPDRSVRKKSTSIKNGGPKTPNKMKPISAVSPSPRRSTRIAKSSTKKGRKSQV